MSQIALESREFLISLFTELRADLKGDRAIYDALLSGLAEDGELPPEDETLREYVTGLARAIDEENRYEQAVLEHRAFAELARALGAPTDHGPSRVDWDGLRTLKIVRLSWVRRVRGAKERLYKLVAINER